MQTNIHISGGDLRSYFAAKHLALSGYRVNISGFELYLPCSRELNKVSMKKPGSSDILLLPIPYCDKEGFIKTPYSKEKVTLEQLLETHSAKTVFLGMANERAMESIQASGATAVDYLLDEEFVQRNAHLTAQAAVHAIFDKCDTAPSEASVLIVGAGRIGTALQVILNGYGTKTALTTRQTEKLTKPGYVSTESIEDIIHEYDIAVNTVPTTVLTRACIKNMRAGGLIIDLASYPHGVDFDACASFGIRSYIELGLPGRYYPQSAGRAIAEVIQRSDETEAENGTENGT